MSGRTTHRDRPSMTLHRAPWLVMPGSGEGQTDKAGIRLVVEGALAVDGSGIQAMGRFDDLREEYITAPIVDHEGAVLTPPLLNGHSHLELSVLGEAADSHEPGKAAGAFPDWIKRLLDRLTIWRASAGPAWQDRMLSGGRMALAALYDAGVGTVLDVGNNVASIGIGSATPVRTIFFLEMLGLSGDAEQEALERLARDIPPEVACTPHAPYSCSPELLRRLKKRATDAGRLMTIHVAESAEEVEFLRQGSGPFQSFLEGRGVLDGSFAVPGCGPVEYLNRLGVLDRNTLCVHGVHLSDWEIGILAARGAALCLCPGSNRHLAVGKAPVDKLMAASVRLILGTDSLASNATLSMWREMRLLREDHPFLDPAQVLAMATEGGTQLAAPAGRTSPRASFLAVRPAEAGRLSSEEQVLEFLTREGETAAITRIGGEPSMNSDQ